MHLLASQSGVIDANAEAVDLGQDPADVIVISAADSELAALAHAHDALAGTALSLRLANQMALSHNLSVDTYLERTAGAARLIVARVLGGRAYWPYGVDRLAALARQRGIALAMVAGGNDRDEELTALSTLPPAQVERLRQYLAAGGGDNARRFLQYAAWLLERGDEPDPPAALDPAGLYRRASPEGAAGEAAIVFYRALIEGGLTAPVDALCDTLADHGVAASAIYVTSLKDPACRAVIGERFGEVAPDVIVNATGFATGHGRPDDADHPFAGCHAPVLQIVFAGASRAAWLDSDAGLAPRDLAMNVVLPELDGRIMTRAVSFKTDRLYHQPTQANIVAYEAEPERIAFVSRLAANWVRLRHTPPRDRRIAMVLANYPNRDGRIANGVGYDTPQSSVNIARALAGAGYDCKGFPPTGNDLIKALQSGVTNAAGAANRNGDTPALALERYLSLFARLPETTRKQVSERWGKPARDPFFAAGAFHLPARRYGNLVVAIQPARGYNIDPKETYHDPALPPPHGYLAFYFWLREEFAAHAVIHNGKHGNLEWLPGKALALSSACFPEAALGPVPHVYPFIVNDPGEGAQAKRRAGAVIIDHLTPPLTRAESYGELAELEGLLDEYYLASGLDRRRLDALARQILDLTRSCGLDVDAGIDHVGDDGEALRTLDAWLCDVKEAQIRDGLHILGESPDGEQLSNLIVALTRPERGDAPGERSLIRALADDLHLSGFDPFDCDLAAPWTGPRPQLLQSATAAPWRSHADTLERLERLALAIVDGAATAPGPASQAVVDEIDNRVRPALAACGSDEIANLLAALDGRFVPPGPAGAPTRGRLDVLPTGRNFYSLDNRTLPTPTAWDIGKRSAEAMLTRHFHDHGRYPAAIGLSVWGTANMRTGGDDIAQALALIGARPRWHGASGRVTGYEIMTLAELGRPRVDVTLRISGFFRDAFPAQIELFDKAARAIGRLDEDAADNPLAARMKRETGELLAAGLARAEAERAAGFRVFGSRPGAYGAGLQALIDEKLWAQRADLARAYMTWGAYAYGAGADGKRDEARFAERLRRIEAVVHNQDNREHDILDSDDYYQFEGGMSAAVETLSGERPVIYHNDHSRPERPLTRTLEEEVARVMRSRVVNPKWIAGVKRHGYKGAFEIAATVDYMFAFAATTGAVRSHHFELAYDAFINDDDTRAFIADNNPAALAEIAARFDEAIARGLWTPRSNFAYHLLETLKNEAA